MLILVRKAKTIPDKLWELAIPPRRTAPIIPDEYRAFASDTQLPTLRYPVSQLCTRNQFDEPEYKYWADQLNEAPRFSRKQWEFVYILRVLQLHGMLKEGMRGIGFGVGKEPLPAVFAKHGVEVLATDLDRKDAKSRLWVKSRQHAQKFEDLRSSNICDADTLSRRVRSEAVDMNKIPERYRGFDFCWSACAFEHLGSINSGLEFVRNSLKCLKPGGVAVHTTEYNCYSDSRTIRYGVTVLFRMRDLLRLGADLRTHGHEIQFNLFQGNDPVDLHVDVPPYAFDPHLKIELRKFVTVSIGLLVTVAA
jgi:SAM-dependent methyltransferase